MLKGIRVLDSGAFTIGPAAAAILGGLGAVVIRIEPPHIDGLMHVGTFQKGAGTGYISSHFNKRNIVLNMREPDGLGIAMHLARTADVIIENHVPGAMERLGFGYEAVSEVNPSIIYCSCSGYGETGPMAKLRGADHYVQASSCFASLNGAPCGPPEILRYIAHLDWTSSLTICEGVLMSLIQRERSGEEGQRITTSGFEVSLALQSTRVCEYFATGKEPVRRGSASSTIAPSQAFRTLEGRYVNVSIAHEEDWPNLCNALGIEELEKDPRFSSNTKRMENAQELIPILEEKFASEPLRWWLIHLNRHGVACGLYYDFDGVCRDPHIQETKGVVMVDTPWGKAAYGNLPLKFSAAPREIVVRGAVEPDHDREEILKELEEMLAALPPEQKSKKAPKQGPLPTTRPLEGIKVIELSDEIAGQYLGRTLGDAGAEVIKVELPEGDRMRGLGPTIKNESSLFLELNRSKKGIAIDYRTDQGRSILHQLVAQADVFIETFRANEAHQFNLDYETLKKRNPQLIYCSISPFGSSGPYRNRTASELEIQGMAGYLQYLGELGKPPVRLGADVAEVAAAKFASIGILSCLYYRMKTGIGQKVETSLLGALLCTGSNWLTAFPDPDHWGGWFLTGPYDHPETGYQTKDKSILFGLAFGAGRQEKSWAGFCQKVGLDDLMQDPWFQKYGWRVVGAGRDAQEMKPVFETAFADKTAQELVEIIDSVGGRVGILESYNSVINGPQVQALDMIREIDHPTVGPVKTLRPPWSFSKSSLEIALPAPIIGQHTRETLSDAGFSTAEIEQFIKTKIVAQK